MPDKPKKSSIALDFVANCIAAPFAVSFCFPLYGWLSWLQTAGKNQSPLQFSAAARTQFPQSRVPILRLAYLGGFVYTANAIPSKVTFFFPALVASDQYPDQLLPRYLAYASSGVLQSLVTYPARLKQIYSIYGKKCPYSVYLNPTVLKQSYLPWLLFLLAANATTLATVDYVKSCFDTHSLRGKFVAGAIGGLLAQPIVVTTEHFATQYMNPFDRQKKVFPTRAMFAIRTSWKMLELGLLVWGTYAAKAAIEYNSSPPLKKGVGSR